MLREARLRPDGGTLFALAFVLWATASPSSLALVVRTLILARNTWASRYLKGLKFCEWRPRLNFRD